MGANQSKNLEYCNYTSMRLLDAETAGFRKKGEGFYDGNIHDLIEKARSLKHSDFNESFSLYFKCIKILKQVKNEKSQIYKNVVEFDIKPLNMKNEALKFSSEKLSEDRESINMGSMSSINSVNTSKSSSTDNIKLNKQIASIYNEIGDLFCIHDQLEKSLLYYEKACGYDPSKIDYIYKKGVVYQQMNENEKAIITFKRILSANEGHIPTLFAIGNLYRYIDTKNALKYFEAILKKEPDNTEVLSLVASCYDELGNVNEAIVYQNRALQINPDNFNHKKFAEKLIATKMQN